MFIGYARETTGDLSIEEQTTRLKAAGCADVFRETNWSKRPVLWRAIQACGRGDTLVVVNLVRMAWNARELFEIWVKLDERGAGIHSLTEPWADPKDDSGKHFPTILEGLARFEVEGKADRMRTIRGDAVAQGKLLGRQRKLTPEQEAAIREAYGPGVTMTALAARHKVNISTISRLLSPKRKAT